MFLDTKAKLVPLTALKDWNVDETGVHCRKEACFDVEYFDIEISGREVRNWEQPLLCARGIGTFGLFVCRHEGVTKFLVSIKTEIGAFDSVEIGIRPYLWKLLIWKKRIILQRCSLIR